MAVLLGITGKAGSGKDTVADWFKTRRSAASYSFAMPLKAGICEMFSLPMSVFNDRKLKELPLAHVKKSPREMAQLLGTEWGRTLIHPDVWVIAAERALRAAKVWDSSRIVVIPDTRFENEAAWVREHGTVIHLDRDDVPGQVGVPNHASEAGVARINEDIVLTNNGTINDLYLKLEQMFPIGMEQAVN